jgi:hypothetical protein
MKRKKRGSVRAARDESSKRRRARTATPWRRRASASSGARTDRQGIGKKGAERHLPDVVQDVGREPERGVGGGQVGDRRPAEEKEPERRQQRHPVLRATPEDHHGDREEHQHDGYLDTDADVRGVELRRYADLSQILEACGGEPSQFRASYAGARIFVERVGVRDARRVEPEDNDCQDDPRRASKQEGAATKRVTRRLLSRLYRFLCCTRTHTRFPSSCFFPSGSCSHSEACTGWIVSRTTPTRASFKASRLVSSCSFAEKAPRVFPASYFFR